MKKKKIKAKKRKISKSSPARRAENLLTLHSELAAIKKNLETLNESAEKHEERIQDIEIHINLLTRLLTTLCIEKFGMRVGVLKRLIKRIEKEAVRDSQIHHLETLYKLPAHSDKKGHPPSKNDPWEEIS